MNGSPDQVFQLENYRGPLDLLLHLVREQEVDVLEVDLSRLCDQYLAALHLMQAVDIDVAGEFLVLASSLVLIKSRAILPREEEVDLEEELDPADELIQQLLEYRRYKTLSLELGRRAGERAQRVARGASESPPDEEGELAEIGLWDLVGAFVRLMEEVGLNRQFHTLRAEKPLRVYMRSALSLLVSRERATLRELVDDAGGPAQVLGVFLSLLELAKTQQIVVRQEARDGPIVVELRQDRDPSAIAFLDDPDPTPPLPGDDGDEPVPPARATGGEDDADPDAAEHEGAGREDVRGTIPGTRPPLPVGATRPAALSPGAPSSHASADAAGAARLAGPSGAGMVSPPPPPADESAGD